MAWRFSDPTVLGDQYGRGVGAKNNHGIDDTTHPEYHVDK